MRLYLAGPMTDYPAYNVAAFERAAALLASLGHTPLLPFESNSAVWRRHYGRDFDPHTDTCDYGDPILKEMIAEDVALLCTAEGVALLPGWERSRGVKPELLIALNLQMPIFDAETGECRAVVASPQFYWAARELPPLIGDFVKAMVPITRGPEGMLGRWQPDLLDNSYGKR